MGNTKAASYALGTPSDRQSDSKAAFQVECQAWLLKLHAWLSLSAWGAWRKAHVSSVKHLTQDSRWKTFRQQPAAHFDVVPERVSFVPCHPSKKHHNHHRRIRDSRGEPVCPPGADANAHVGPYARLRHARIYLSENITRSSLW